MTDLLNMPIFATAQCAPAHVSAALSSSKASVEPQNAGSSGRYVLVSVRQRGTRTKGADDAMPFVQHPPAPFVGEMSVLNWQHADRDRGYVSAIPFSLFTDFCGTIMTGCHAMSCSNRRMHDRACNAAQLQLIQLALLLFSALGEILVQS